MKKSIKTVGFMFVMILLSKVLGQAREMLIAQLYGSSGDASAFYGVSALPLNLFDIVFASAVSSAFIPVYNTYLEKDGEQEGDRFASAFLNVIFLGSVVFTGILMLLASPLVSIMAGGLVGQVRQTAIKLLVIMLPMTVFASLAFSLVGLLQSKGEFTIPAMMSLISNGVVILYLCLGNRYFGIEGLAVSLVIGWALQFAIQIPVAKKKGFHYQPVLRHEGLKTVVKLALPVMVGTWIQPISTIINNAFGSSIPGALTTLNWANKLYLIVSSVFTVSLTNYIFPRLSRQSVQEDSEAYKNTLKVSFLLIVTVLIPITVLMLAFKTPIIEIVYKRGAFTEKDLYLTAGAFFYYSLGIPFYGLLDLLNKAYYARKNMLIPSVTAAAAIVFNIALSFFLKSVMASFGLALATSLTAVFMSGILLILLNHELGFLQKTDFFAIVRYVIYGALMFPVCILCYKVFPGKETLLGNIAAVGISALAGLLLYGSCVLAFQRDVREFIKKGILKR
ncbi:MAG: murein biosynthesis integral membrane protein MurJ [Clostridia bacterium]|nr:murein biosynthesis integral membrane protein MurJ [Clostridia bacterium]